MVPDWRVAFTHERASRYHALDTKGYSVNSLAQGLISVVVGALVAVLETIGLVNSQSAPPEPVSTDVITYDS